MVTLNRPEVCDVVDADTARQLLSKPVITAVSGAAWSVLVESLNKI